MKAIMVSVNYADLLAITLPYNRRHFEEIWVVTDGSLADAEVAEANDCHVMHTHSFYANGAAFNKWLALEEGLDAMGRDGWICLMDADVLWPKSIKVDVPEPLCVEGRLTIQDQYGGVVSLPPGVLCTPLRRMWSDWPRLPISDDFQSFERLECGAVIPAEKDWCKFPIHRNVREWAGYSQIFHASDPALGPPPWHETNWVHAGGADSFFQRKWPQDRKVRPPFEVLHLGPAGQNWMGRATPLVDGSVLPGSTERREMSGRTIWERRLRNLAEGRDQFDGEKLK